VLQNRLKNLLVKNKSMKIHLKVFGHILVLFLFVSYFYFLHFESAFFWRSTAYLLLPILTLIMGMLLANMYGLRNKNGLVVFLFTLGVFCWVVGELTWYVFDNFLYIDPFPSYADFFFLLGYPIIFWALYKQYKYSNISLEKIPKKYLKFVVSFTTLASALVLYFGVYLAYTPGKPFFENFIAMSYGFGDLLLIVMAVLAALSVLVYKGGKFSYFWTGLAVGLFFFLLADIVFAMNLENYETGLAPYSYIDFLWLLGYFAFLYTFTENYVSLNNLKLRLKMLK